MKKLIDFLAPRIVLYCLGMLILATGICFCVASNLGTSPISSIPNVISICANLDLGFCTTAVLSTLIVIQFLILGKNFKPVMLFQLFPSMVIGVFVSYINRIFAFLPAADVYPLQLLYCVIGIVLSAIGIMTYLDHNIVSLPAEGMVEAFVYRFHLDFSYAKMLVDLLMVMGAVSIGFICTGGLLGVREGTALSVFGVGFCIKTFRKIRSKREKA